MSNYSTTAPTFSASLLTSNDEFDYTENLELSPSSTGEKANAVISSETATTNPPQTLPQPTQPFNYSSTSQTISPRNSFFSLFKKKEIVNNVNNVSSSRPISSPPQQRVVSSTYNNKNTTEEITKNNNYFATDHNVSQSAIGSVSVPNLIASNTDASLETEYDALMKQKQANGLVNNSSDGLYGSGSGVTGGKSQSKKSGKRKDSLVSIDKNDDKRFKVRYYILTTYSLFKQYYGFFKS